MKLIYRDYEKYRQAQVAENARKESFVWATDHELESIIKHLRSYIQRPDFGICQGSRNGWEVTKFRQGLNCLAIGTDISPACGKYGLICHDMHLLIRDCADKCDFVYSNSFDHCYDLPLFLETQAKHLSGRGWLYLTYSDDKREPANESDCLGMSLKELIDLCKARFSTVELLTLGDIYNKSFGATLKGLCVVCCKK